jgi:RHS repeat-associated protein
MKTTLLGQSLLAGSLAGRRTNVGGSSGFGSPGGGAAVPGFRSVFRTGNSTGVQKSDFARTGMPTALTSASYNAGNQLTQFGPSSLTYDANGNLTSDAPFASRMGLRDGTNTYTWSARNQLIAISGGVSANFQYDAFGRRVSKTVAGTTQYLYDGVNPVQELSGTSVSANLLTGLGLDEYFQRTDANGPANFLTDALGSTVALTGASGATLASYIYEPFGNATVSGSSSNSYQFTARENDGTGLYFFRARYYSPTLQRFLSEDPIGSTGAYSYRYAENDPILAVDPLGLTWIYSQGAGTLSYQYDENSPGFYGIGPGYGPGGVPDYVPGPVLMYSNLYAGRGQGVNNPGNQNVGTGVDADVTDPANAGPLPQGWYSIGPMQQTGGPTANAMQLLPDTDDQMFGRNDFWFHGDWKQPWLHPPQSASSGCIVGPLGVRQAVANSGDNRLEVVP